MKEKRVIDFRKIEYPSLIRYPSFRLTGGSSYIEVLNSSYKGSNVSIS